MVEKPLRVLQVGLGARGRKWSQIVRASAAARPVGYVDPRPEAAAWASTEAHLPAPVFADLESALRRVDADVALVVTPPDGRVAQVTALLDRGLHILAEKPLTLTLDEATTLARAAERAGKQLGVVHNFRYFPASQRLREIVRSGKYGVPTFATLTYIRNRDGMAPHLNKYPLVMAQPMLVEQSIHHLDLLRFVYDAEPEDVSAVTWNPAGSMYRDDACAAALIRMTGGLVVTYHGTWVSGSHTLAFQWRTDFERGVAIQRDLFGDLVEGAVGDSELRPVPLEPVEPFTTESARLLDDFLGSVRRDEPFASSARDHLRTLGLTLACIESSRTGARVSMREFLARHGVTTTF
ncbi:MAG: Gfo/Idh/MocA family oxidoreductase [Armatimonadota bacterium]|nr:Gfo/Idh/MocA family oxidoreductase [Armatimonadota bacterium]